jgi:OPA family glycerol-3-phosphate transporter-like MFS transporter
MPLIRILDEYPTGGQRKKILSMAILASLICSYEGAIAPVLPLMLKDLKMSLSTYGLIAAAALVLSTVAAVVGGRLADRIGRVRLLVPMMALTALLAFAMALVTNVTEFAIMRCVLYIVETLAGVSTIPLVRDFSPRMGRAQAMGFWTCGPVGANFLSAALAGATLPLFHNAWQSQFIIIGCVSLVSSIIIAFNIADLSPRLRAVVQHTEHKSSESAVTTRSLLSHWVIWAHCLGISLWLVFFITVTAFGQTVLVQAFGKKPAEASTIMACFWVLNIFTTVLVGRWSDALQLRRIFSLVFTLIAVCFGFYYIYLMAHVSTTSTGMLMIVGALIGGAMGGAYSTWMALYSENAEEIDARLQGMAWGLFNASARIVAVIIMICAPMLVEHTHSWRGWFIFSMICMLVFIIASFSFKGPWTRSQVKHNINLVPAPD